MIDDMQPDAGIDLSGQISVSFLKKRRFTGSYKGMRYVLYSADDENGVLRAVIWPEPMNYEHTPDEKKHGKDFTLDDKGLSSAIAWLNEEYKAGRY